MQKDSDVDDSNDEDSDNDNNLDNIEDEAEENEPVQEANEQTSESSSNGEPLIKSRRIDSHIVLPTKNNLRDKNGRKWSATAQLNKKERLLDIYILYQEVKEMHVNSYK